MGNQTITLIKHIKTETADSYACYSMPNASWFASLSIATDGDGAKPVNTYTVRIPAEHVPVGVVPDMGDVIAKGVVTNVTRPADLKTIEHFRITAVGCNLRGLLQHWRVSGS
jgi:hypothetical protein